MHHTFVRFTISGVKLNLPTRNLPLHSAYSFVRALPSAPRTPVGCFVCRARKSPTIRMASKKVEVGIHSSTSRLASLCMGLVIEKAVTLRETLHEVDSTTNKTTPCQQRFGNSRRCLTSGSVNLQDDQEVSDCSFYRGDGWALRFYPELDEKQPSEQPPHAWSGTEKFDELAGGGDR
jgi:hypothetical protein